MTESRFLARGKAVVAAAIVSASVLGASPAMAGPVAAGLIAPICLVLPWLCPVIVPPILLAPTP